MGVKVLLVPALHLDPPRSAGIFAFRNCAWSEHVLLKIRQDSPQLQGLVFAHQWLGSEKMLKRLGADRIKEKSEVGNSFQRGFVGAKRAG